MTTAYYSHKVCIDHQPGPGHPESPERLKVIYQTLDGNDFSSLKRLDAPKAKPNVVELMHDTSYVNYVLDSIPSEGYKALDPDTYVSPSSGEAALYAIGGVCDAIDLVVRGEADNAFCAFRPPGHHAERDRAMGFCLFNNVAVAAKYAQVRYGIEKVAVVDFDVHHGNGTQHMFELDPSLFYASSHQVPAYPGTGAALETGVGNIFNVPLSPNSGSVDFRKAYTDVIIPALEKFKPDFILISAGFDAHASDPLCQLNVKTEDFGWITEQLLRVASESCDGKVISTLEGGYDLKALSDSVAAHVHALMVNV